MSENNAPPVASSDLSATIGYDAYGFPDDMEYLPSSDVATLVGNHHKRWAHYWKAATREAGGTPTHLPRTRLLRELVWGGVPAAFRGYVWTVLLGVSERRHARPGHYAALLALEPVAEGAAGDGEAARGAADSEAAEQIRKDADRTWPRHRWLDAGALVRVLVAFARHNRAIGYCQGLNTVAAVFLLFMGEEDAFWCLVQLVESRMPAGFWSDTLWRSRVEQEVLNALVGRRMPALRRTLRSQRLALEVRSHLRRMRCEERRAN